MHLHWDIFLPLFEIAGDKEDVLELLQSPR